MERIRRLLPYAPYLLLSLVVIGPLLLPGFVLSMDMVFTPVLRMPDHVDNTWLFYAALHLLNTFLPADFIQKVMLISILLLSGIGAHRFLQLLRLSSEKYIGLAIYAGAAFYMINPFVYDRFMAGQYGVLLGYSLLPWFVGSLRAFVREPGWRNAIFVACWTIGLSIVSIHSLGWAALLAIFALLMYFRDRQHFWQIVKFGLLSVIIFAIAGAYWIMPTVVGQGRIAHSLDTFGGSERQAFATADPNGMTPLGAVLGLQGFWQETHGLFILPMDATPQWGLAWLLIMVLVGYGLWRAWKTQRRRALYGAMVLAAATVLSLGVGGGWLADHVPFFAGFREPQKFVAVIALVYAYFMTCAAEGILVRAVRWRKSAAYLVLVLIAVAILGYTSPMLGGFYGQMQPVRYPDDWTTTNRFLDRQGAGKVLFLPWHLYMSFGFSGRIIANPAADFFDRPIVASDDPELPGVAPQTRNTTREQIQSMLLPAAAKGKPIAGRLRALGIDYILLAKELDWRDYGWLDHQAGIEFLRESPSLKLYRIIR